MAELEEKLNAILSDPEAMGQIVSIAKALTGETDPAPAQETGEDYQPVEPEAAGASQAPSPDWGAVMGLLSGSGDNGLSALKDLDPRLISAAVRLFSEYSATDDRKIALFAALKPFLKEERYAKMDKAIQIAKLSRVIRVAFQLFKKEGEDGDV